MIKLTRLNQTEFYVNPHLIEFIEALPDTTIRMMSERKIIVKESIDDIMEKIVDYRKKIGILGNDTPI